MDKDIKRILSKYSAEIKIAFLVSLATTIFGVIANILTEYYDPNIVISIVIGLVISLFLLAILFNLKRLLLNFVSNVNTEIIVNRYKYLRKDKYVERLSHFTEEKQLLANTLVNITLPKIIEIIHNENRALKELCIILDSGTTITPIFEELISNGIKYNSDKIKYKFYTNNLAGIDELHSINPKVCKIDEREFILIAGRPLNTYRATTGDDTQKFLKTTIWDEQNNTESEGTSLSLGILTANWFTCGLGFQNISLCAKGEGHFEFKQDVISHCHYNILVSPLGKLLPLHDEKILNELVPKETDQQYRSFPIPIEKIKKTYLLTTLRPDKSPSPITTTSIHLRSIKHDRLPTNYILCEGCPVYNPSSDKYGITVLDLPHQYIRDNYEKVFHQRLL